MGRGIYVLWVGRISFILPKLGGTAKFGVRDDLIVPLDGVNLASLLEF